MASVRVWLALLPSANKTSVYFFFLSKTHLNLFNGTTRSFLTQHLRALCFSISTTRVQIVLGRPSAGCVPLTAAHHYHYRHRTTSHVTRLRPLCVCVSVCRSWRKTCDADTLYRMVCVENSHLFGRAPHTRDDNVCVCVYHIKTSRTRAVIPR